MRESLGNPRRRSSVVEQRFRNFLCSITANSPESLGIGATTGGRHRIRHTELLCGLSKRVSRGAGRLYRRRLPSDTPSAFTRDAPMSAVTIAKRVRRKGRRIGVVRAADSYLPYEQATNWE